MTAGRIYQTAQTHYVGGFFTYAKFAADAAVIKIGTIPKGSLVKVGTINVSTALSVSSLSLCQIEVGTIANPSLFLAGTGADTFSAAFTSINTGRGLLASDTDVYVRLSKNAMAAMPTAGVFQYMLEYFPPNVVKDINSTFD